MIKTSIEAEKDTVYKVADAMATAAKTAPKSHGRDIIDTLIISGEEKDNLCDKMKELGKALNLAFFERDADCLKACELVVVVGVKSSPCKLPDCPICRERAANKNFTLEALCSMNATDLGIAIGSAVSIAADNRIDNRVMFSVGKGVIALGYFDEDIQTCYGIPLYTGAKSIFFDRAPGMIIK